jgi:ABC-type antimicrobial peptide transport system permease subunit
VISDARSTGTSVEALNEIYVPFAQSLGSTGLLIVESSASSSELTEIVRNEVRSVLPELPLRRGQAVTPFTELIRRSLARQRFAATLVSVFSGVALLLAISGVFGLVSYSISQRKRELGVRAALGARPRDLGMTTVRPVLVLTLLGIALGAMTAAYVTRFVQSQLEGVQPVDLPIFAGTAIGMFVVAGVAALIPARHAMTADPGIVLRHE